MRLFVLQKKLLQFFQTKDYKIKKILEDINFILYLSYLSNILGVMNHRNCYLQGPESNIVDFAIKLTTSGVSKVRLPRHMRLFDPQDVALKLFVSNIVDFAIKLTTSGVGEVRLARHMRLFDPQDVALQFFVSNIEDLFLFCNCAYTPLFPALVWSKTFFCSSAHRLQLFSCSTFPQVPLLMKILPYLHPNSQY